jgi:hypothetical protein
MSGLPRFPRNSATQALLAIPALAGMALVVAFIGADLLVGAPHAASSDSVGPSGSAGASPNGAATTGTPSTPGAAWTSIEFTRVSSAPFGKATTSSPSVVAWKGGYLAVGYSRDVEGQAGTFGGWVSTDAMSWQRVPDGAFSADSEFGAAAPCGSGAVVVVNGSNNALAYYTNDGKTWTQTQTLDDGFMDYPPRLTGTDAGAAIVLGGFWGQTSLWYTGDCQTWNQVTLPQGAAPSITPMGVTTMNGGFLAYGALSPKDPAAASIGAAWWSVDGKNWTAKSLPASPSLMYGASNGAAASLEAQFQPGMDTVKWASSPDGATWQMAPTTPVFVPTLGQAASDGRHIVVMGSVDGQPPFGLWSSIDGAHWHSLAVYGDPGATDGDPGALDFFVLPDGVVRISAGGVWYGAASTAPVPAQPSTEPTPLPSLSGTVPPASTAAWSSLTVRPLSDGPTGATSVASWPGGYLAVRDADASSATPMAWVSRDGASWLRLPQAGFGNATRLMAGRCRDQVLVVAGDAAGVTSIWRSGDGLAWHLTTAPNLQVKQGALSGNARGAIAITSEGQIASTTDCASWQTVDLTNGPDVELGPIAASDGTYFVSGCAPLADRGAGADATSAPTSWWSTDGQQWHAAAGASCLTGLSAGGQGFVTETRPQATPGTVEFLGSADGRNWSAYDDPLGYWSGGEGSGSANGGFLGDGTRILGYGTPIQSQVLGYWTSLDGRHWTELHLSGDTSGFSDNVTPVLLRNGILFLGPQGTWFGAAAPI